MSLVAGCPRCSVPVLDDRCAEHPGAGVLWRAGTSDYAAFGEVLQRAGDTPVYVPRPMVPGWSITDFGTVEHAGRAAGTFTSLAGIHEVDGPVEITVVVEDAGVGLGGRVAGLGALDPGGSLGRGRAPLRIRLDHHVAALWPVPSSSAEEPLATAVLAGESGGRWLWVVVRPASAALLLRTEWSLASAADLGPALVELPFGGPGPRW